MKRKITASKIKLFLITVLAFSFFACANNNVKVSSVKEFNRAVSNAQPGDTIVIANGNYKDFKLGFFAKGTKEAPIVFKAETKGKVILEGESILGLAGEFLEVSGLYFTNGTSTKTGVIVFRKDKNNLANNCRVTNCVIDFYNPVDRFYKNDWVILYGRNNRVDHCYFGGKLNSGVTLVVKLNDAKNRENHHRIDHNWFGERIRLGSNGGETMRVGVSTFSLMPSNTIIENNYFERCNGETEIVSIKSSDNIIRNNTFMECEGALVLRHGNGNLLEGNYFIGNNKEHTGGIRVINKGHTIRNNHFQELKGNRFRAALPVMNGVPNSLLNRYHQVDGVTIEDNHFIYCDNVSFGVGSDMERTAVPVNSVVKNNVFYNPDKETVFNKLDDISGLKFAGNKVVNKSGKFNYRGFATFKTEFVKKNGLWGNQDHKPELPASRENCGADWFTPKEIVSKISMKGKTIEVTKKLNSIVEAINNSSPDDIIVLTEEGKYPFSMTAFITHPLTIKAAEGLKARPEFVVEGVEGGISFLSIENGGLLSIKGIAFNGVSENGVSPSAIRTSGRPMIEHYKLFVDNCEFYNFNASKHNAFRAYKSTFADTVKFTNSVFHNISGTAINLSSEKEDAGKYNAEYVIVENCLFYDVMGPALDLYRGGNDESTLGPFLKVNHCTFNNVNNKELGSVLRLIGVQNAEVKNSLFSNSGRGGRVIKLEDPRWADIIVDYCNVYNSGRIESYYKDRVGKKIFKYKPQYKNISEHNFHLKKSDPLYRLSEDGKAVGVL